MEEIKSYAECTFCGGTVTSDSYSTLCCICLGKHEQDSNSFDDKKEEEFRKVIVESVERNKGSQGDYIGECEPNKKSPYEEADIVSSYREQDLTIAREARRSEALQMAYYTLHKLGHFNTGRLPGATPKQQLLHDIEETKEVARNNMKFILEG